MFLFPIQEGSTDDTWDRSSASLRVPSLWDGVLHDLANCMSWRGEEGVHTGFGKGFQNIDHGTHFTTISNHI